MDATGEAVLLDLAIDERSRKILALLGSAPDIGRAIAAEPHIPPTRAAALRKAFLATLEDREFAQDMAKAGLSIDPLGGEELQSLVADTVATPADLIEQAKRYVGP